MNRTSIAWTATRQPDGTMEPGYTWNPIRGCLAVSPGCDACYAAEVAARFGETPHFEGFAKRAPSGRAYFTGKTQFLPKKLNEPLGAKGGVKVFVGSMADLFHKDYTDEELDQVFDVMEQRPDITFQLLTKRPERMQSYVRARAWRQWLDAHIDGERLDPFNDPVPQLASHIWCGTSVEDQRRADERIPILLDTPAAVRFLSVEPMLGPVDLGRWLEHYEPWYGAGGAAYMRGPLNQGIHWVIAGGESGRFRRPMNDEWVRALRDQCVKRHVAFFFKQAGALKSGQRPYLDYWKYEQWPDDLHPPEPYGTCEGENITDAFREAVAV